MKARFILFCIVGILTGACAGMITAVVGLQVVGDMQSNPELTQGYIDVLMKGAAIWAAFGLVSGALLFLFSLGETPIATDTFGRRLGGGGLEKFDYRHIGSKIIYMCAALTVANSFWLIPFLSEPGLTQPRSIVVRLVASIIISSTALIGTFMLVLIILRARARKEI